MLEIRLKSGGTVELNLTREQYQFFRDTLDVSNGGQFLTIKGADEVIVPSDQIYYMYYTEEVDA